MRTKKEKPKKVIFMEFMVPARSGLDTQFLLVSNKCDFPIFVEVSHYRGKMKGGRHARK